MGVALASVAAAADKFAGGGAWPAVAGGRNGADEMAEEEGYLGIGGGFEGATGL